ncbi:sensor histidine kinase [Micromonospora sp. PPF5-17]|uniref:sensor histidine kinase n=1 Tax=Micromonospora TaxID=1873 RepID=UPI00131A3526|nr:MULTISPECIES: sensor histidine kinase [Micromonospora]NES39508.1 sensor histidine kinase [Micromonospora solifontis]NES59050.1 sensor histidine kinase [Micromonospora sp. PPF5-6]
MRSVAGTVLRAPVAARTWREVGYAVTGTVLAVPTFAVALLGLVCSALSLLTIGLPLLTGVLVLARLTVRYFRGPARLFLGWSWPNPPPARRRGLGPMRWAGAVLTDASGWKALAYCFARLPLMAAAAYLGGVLIVGGLLGITYPVWMHRFPQDPPWGGPWGLAGQGLAALLAFPWYFRLIVWLDRRLIRALLEPSPDQARIAALEASRAALRADSAALLQRVERDLHDGTQARLVALGVTLSRMAHRVDEPELRVMVAQARGAVMEALTELRDIVRGIHPPALDAGLSTAIETLAARSAVPVDVHVALPERPAPETESALYFSAAELLTNVAKHAGASRIRLDLRAAGGALRLAVTDDGRGGARPGSGGTGLAGLVRRIESLDGALRVDSPPGGPTTITVELPCEL